MDTGNRVGKAWGRGVPEGVHGGKVDTCNTFNNKGLKKNNPSVQIYSLKERIYNKEHKKTTYCVLLPKIQIYVLLYRQQFQSESLSSGHSHKIKS